MSELFDKASLKFALLGALIMSMQDGDLDEAEFGVVHAFADRHWQPEYGDKGRMIEEVVEYKGKIFNKQETARQRIVKLAEILKEQFNEGQKKAYLDFLQEVLKADGIEETAEIDFYETFAQKLQG